MVVCCDEWSEDQARETAAIFPGAAVATRWQDVIERDDIDAVDICMPNWMHHEIALAAAAAGKHIFVEKPMGLTLAEAKDLATASEKAGKILMVNQNQRFMTEHLAIKKLVDDSAIGKVVAVRFDCNQFLERMYPEGSWMFSRAKTGGGMVITTAVHKIDLLRYFFGEVSQVSSFQGYTGLNYKMDMEDIATMLLEFENGIIAEGFFYFAAYKVPIPTATGELTIIYGDKGIITNVNGWQIYSADVPQYSGGMTHLPIPPTQYRQSLNAAVRHYLECIVENKEPLTSGRDNLGTMAVIDAIYKAAAEKAVVDVAK
jgi:predicted dehydrogenase